MPPVIYEKKDGIGYITLNRPEVYNAMSRQLKSELGKIWADFRDDPEIWVGIVTGAGGKAFSAGSDIKEMHSHLEKTAGYAFLMRDKQDVFKPLIAAVGGWCIGGGFELMLACDIRVATEDSHFGLMEPKIGAIAGGGGTIRLPNQIPFAIAMEMILTGDPISAQRAYEIGLINQLVSSYEELMPAAERMAKRILACAPIAVRVSKEQALKGFSQPFSVGMPMCEIGKDKIFTSQDMKEGVAAFAEKRKPKWTGR